MCLKVLTKAAVLICLVLVVILAGSSPSAVSDNDTSPTGNDISNQEVTTSPTEASNPSTSAAITITMTGVRDEQHKGNGKG